MRTIKQFDEFISTGIVKRQSPNISRAKSLIKESEQDYSLLLELVKKIPVQNKNANFFVKSCYDILMQIIRAKMLLKGLNASGLGAHEAEVSYMRILNFNEKDIQLADQLRYFRNGMLYYGTILDKEYAKKVVNFTKRIYAKIKKDCK